MNDEINLGTMTIDSSPKNVTKPHNFYRLNNSGLSNDVVNGAIVMRDGKIQQ